MKPLTQVGQIQIHREWALERSSTSNINAWRTSPFAHCLTKEEIWNLYDGRVRLSVRELVKRLDKHFGYSTPYPGVNTAWFLGKLFLFPDLEQRFASLVTEDVLLTEKGWALCRYVEDTMSLQEVYEAFFSQPIPKEWPCIFLPNKPFPYIPGEEPEQEA